MDKKEITIKNHPSVAELMDHLKSPPIDMENEKYDHSTVFNGHVYAHLCESILSGAKITPIIAQTIAKFHLMHYVKPMSFLIFINRRRRVKDIVNLTTGFRAVISDFTNDIVRMCGENKCNKCILIYNYVYKKGPTAEIYDLNSLYNGLAGNGICLVDAIRYHNSTAENIISKFNKNGYK